MYQIVFDEKNSYIVESETGIPFDQAVAEILEYCREASYDLQVALWELIQSEGEQQYSSLPVTLT